MKKRSRHGDIASTFAIAIILVFARVSSGQTGPDLLALSSGTATSDGTVALNLVLTSPSGSEPAAIQWTLTYPAANVAFISASAGSALTAAGKTLTCSAGSGTYTCVASGMNADIISNGTVAIVNLTMATGVNTSAIGVSNTAASSPAGNGIVLFATGGAVAPVLVSTLTCNPNSLTGGTSSACTVTLSQPSVGFSLVSISSNNPNLSVPTGVSIRNGATTGTFNVAAAATITSNQNAIVSTALGYSTVSTSISLVPVLVSTLICNPTSLGQDASNTCTAILTQPAPMGGASVALTTTNATLTVPMSVTVAAGATMATFYATTTTISSNQSATVTATYNNSSANVSVSLIAPVLVSTLTCNPTSLTGGTSSACTVTLNQTSVGFSLVSINSNNPNLSVPTGVSIRNGATAGTFNVAAAATIASNQSATVSTVLGNSTVSTTINLVAPVLVSTLICNAPSLGQNSSILCTVTLTQAAPAGGASVTLSNTNATLTVAGSVTVAAAATTATFCATTTAISSNQSATITATYNNSSANATVGLVASLVSTLTCNPTSLGQNSSILCTVTLTQAAPAGGASVTLSNTNATLTVPGSVTVAAAAATATFYATTTAISSNQSATITATYNNSSANATVGLVASLVSTLTCNPTSLGQNSSILCTVTLTQAAPAGGASVTLSNTNATLTVPGSVTVAAAAATATFYATTTAISSNQSATITATYNNSSANATVGLVASLVSTLTCNPTSLGPNASSLCTVTLTQAAPAGGASVTLTNTNSTLTVPASVTIAPAATMATFYATTTAISSNQSATITATYNNSSANATVGLVAPVVSTLTCNPPSLGQNSSSLCTVTLTQAAPAGGASVTLTNTNATLTVPASVTVAPAATMATFYATTTTINSNQSATITATYNNSSANATVGLVAPVVSTLTCNPASLGPNASSLCTVTLTQAAPAGGASVTLTNTNATLTVPASVTVAPAATMATFYATTTTINSNQSATITATYNNSSANATVGLVAPVVSTLTCNPPSLGQNSSSLCTVTLTQAAPAGGASVTLTNTNATLTVPTSVTVATGVTSATFSATTTTVPSNQSATVTGAIGSSTETTTLSLVASAGLVSLACAANSLTGGTSSACTVTLSQPSVGFSLISINSNNPNLSVPAGVTIRNGATTGTFNVAAAATIASNQNATVSTVLGNSTVSTNIGLVASGGVSGQVNQISCTPKSLTSSSRGTCRITLGHVEKSTSTEVWLSSSSASLRLPEKVVTRPGQSTVEFQADAVSSGEDIVVAANVGSDMVKETVTVTPDRSTGIHIPGPRFVKSGTEVRFQVSAADPAATLSTGALPAGAYFDSTTGEFWWTPDGTQLGAHNVSFNAIDSAGGKASASVMVQVDSGPPVVTRIVNAASRSEKAACSPGSIASIEGRWLIDGAAVSDPSGNSLEIAGTKVWVNGITVPILSASSTKLNILCPNSVPGSELQFVVEAKHGVAQPIGTTALAATPGIFSLDGSGVGQGWVVLEGAERVAMVRNYRVPAQPAVPGERLLIYATGIDQLTNVSVRIGEYKVPAAAINIVPNHPGLYQIVVSVPDLVPNESDIPLSLCSNGPISTITSNVVSVAIEGAINENVW